MDRTDHPSGWCSRLVVAARLLALAPVSDEPSKVLGADFRIKEVKDSWQKVFEEVPYREFQILRLRVIAGSGTYMRSLAGRIGKSLSTKALALSIRRTKIGKYASFGRFGGFWLSTYR